MTDLSKLRSLEPNSLEWEAERSRLLRDLIMSFPDPTRKKLLALQLELDLVRDRSTPEEFMQYLLHVARENAENAEDQLLYLKNKYNLSA